VRKLCSGGAGTQRANTHHSPDSSGLPSQPALLASIALLPTRSSLSSLVSATHVGMNHTVFWELHAATPCPMLSPILFQAAAMIDNKYTKSIQKKTNNTLDNSLFFHQEFHPAGIHNQAIQNIYKNALHGYDNFDKMIIATSRPKNLRDLLCKTQLLPKDHNPVSVPHSSLK